MPLRLGVKINSDSIGYAITPAHGAERTPTPHSSAQLIIEMLDNTVPPEAIEIGEPTDDAEARSMGFDDKHHWRAHTHQVIQLLPPEIAALIVYVPRGSTPATASAILEREALPFLDEK